MVDIFDIDRTSSHQGFQELLWKSRSIYVQSACVLDAAIVVVVAAILVVASLTFSP